VSDVGRLCGEKSRKGPEIGDVVFSSDIRYYGYQNVESGKRKIRITPVEPPTGNLRGIAQAIKSEWKHNEPEKIHESIILSGDNVINDPKFVKDIICPQLSGEKIIVFETEAGGVARAIYDVINKKKPSFLVIQGISDFVDISGDEETRRNNRVHAARAAAIFAYELFKKISDAEFQRRRQSLQPYLHTAKRLFEEKKSGG